MTRAILTLVLASALAGWLDAQQVTDDPGLFREAVDMRTSIADLFDAIDDPIWFDEFTGRVLVLDGIVESILVDESDGYYAEVEVVAGRWNGLASVDIFRAFFVITDPALAGIVAERPPRDGGEDLVVRGDRVLIAAQLVDRFEFGDGTVVPVLVTFDLREID